MLACGCTGNCRQSERAGKRGRESFAGTALRVLRTNDSRPLFPARVLRTNDCTFWKNRNTKNTEEKGHRIFRDARVGVER